MRKEVLRLQVYDYKFFVAINIKGQFEKVFQDKNYYDYAFIGFTISRNCIELVFQSKSKGKK